MEIFAFPDKIRMNEYIILFHLYYPIIFWDRPWKALLFLINATKTHWKYFMKYCEPFYFLGICIQLSCVMSARWLQKASFRPITTIRNWIKVEPHYVPAQGPPLSTKVSISSIDPADVKLVTTKGC